MSPEFDESSLPFDEATARQPLCEAILLLPCPLPCPSALAVCNVVSAHRSTAFVQDTWRWATDAGNLDVNLGFRAHRWSVLPDPWRTAGRNTHLVGGPRAHASFTPAGKPLTSYRLSGGYYYQPPFYREMRGLDGLVKDDLAPQRAIHAVAGVDHQFKSK